MTDYPQIRGDKIIFENRYDVKSEEIERTLRPLTLENVTEQEFEWLKTNAKGKVVINCGYQGISHQDYDLIRNPKNNQVALKWQGLLRLDPIKISAVRFYDGLTNEIERLRFVLEEHHKGKVSGWGDSQVPDYVNN